MNKEEWEEKKEKIIKILKQYPKLKSDLIINTVERDNLDCSPQAISYKAITTSPTNRISSVVEECTLKINELNGDAKRLYRKVILIEGALERLTSNQKRAIKSLYFDSHSFEYAAQRFGKGITTLLRWRNAAFREFIEIKLIEKFLEI